MRNLLVILFSSFITIAFSQTYEKDFKALIEKVDNSNVKDEVIEAFMKKYEKDLEKNLSNRSTLYNILGVSAYNRQYFGDAQNNFVNAFNDAYAAGDTIRWGLAQYNMADLYNHVGYYVQAEQLYLYSLPIMARIYGKDSFEYTKMYRALAQLYVELGKYKDAKQMNDALLYYFKVMRGEKDREYLICLNTDAQIAQGVGDYKKAQEIFTGLVKIHGSLNPIDTTDYITTLNNTAEAFRLGGDYKNALFYINKALLLSQKFSKADQVSTATIYNNAGLCYKAIGNYQQAETYYDNSMNLYRKLELTQNPDYTNSLNNKAELYRNLGRYQQAIDLLSEVLFIRKNTTGEKHVNYANALTNVALIYNDEGSYEKAEPYLLKAKDIYKEALGDDHQYYANCIHNLSVLYAHLKRYKEAEVYSDQALIAIKKAVGEEHERYAYFLAGTVTMYDGLQKYDKAVANIELSNAIIKKKFGEKHTAYIDGIFNLAVFQWKLKNYKKAKEQFYEALKSYKGQFDNFFNAMSEREQVSYYTIVGDRFETFNSFVFDYTAKFPKEDNSELLNNCFNYQLFLKSLLLNNNIASRKEIVNSKDTVLISVYNKWIYNKQLLSARYREINSEDNQWSISDVEIETDKLEQTLKSKTSLLSTNKSITITDIKAKLKEGEVAINIIRAPNTYSDTLADYAAFIVEKNSLAPILLKINNSKSFETNYIKEYGFKIENRKEDSLSYDRFWKQIAAKLTGISKVHLSPDGIYNEVNLYTLKNPITSKYVLDEVAISILPNLTYILNATKSNDKKTATLFGFPDYEYDFSKKKSLPPVTQQLAVNRFGFSDLPPLPGTKTEVENISSSLQNNKWIVDSYTKEEASEAQLKKVNSPKVLHIATHGFFLKDIEDNDDQTILGFEASKIMQNPLLRSGIMMAGASVVARDTSNATFDQDGIFTAYEASLLNLTNTDLVVLSACETGLGVEMNNQGVFGLQRAFYIAGAKNLIMSLWVVDDDATQILMSEFYKSWSVDPVHENISVSFKKAQLEVRKKYPHPYYWGAFTLLGN